MPLTAGEALATATSGLAAAGVPTPAVDAELLVAHVLGVPRSGLRTAIQRPLEPQQAAALEDLTRRRAGREPLQLLLGSVGFRYLDIDVRPGVFIPRPETEVLAGLAIDRLRDGAVVVEPCTGTGAVACAVATEASPSLVIATDISEAAVRLARDNVRSTGAKATVLQGDLLAPVPLHHRGSVDVLVSNPPYVATGELAAVEPEVTWDPVTALVSGPTGHEITDRLIADAPSWLRPGGWLLLEVDSSRAVQSGQRLRAGGFTDVDVLPDLTGLDRIVLGRTAR